MLSLCVAVLLACAAGAAADGQRFERGLLWQVSRPGVAPSHIYGTVHLADPRLLPLRAPVADAFRGARRFVMEMRPDDYAGQRFFEGGQFEDGQRLDRLLDAGTFGRLAGRLGSRGFDAETVRRLKPWAALLVLTARPRQTEGVSLDRELYVQARMRRLYLEELDSVEEQLAVFDGVPLASQVALLQFYLVHEEQLAGVAERTLQAYLARDLKALWRVNRDLEADDGELARHQAVLEKKVIHDRSVVMAFRMQPFLRRGGAFVAIGALHLYGDKGVLRLLEQDGWRVKRVD